MITMTRDLAWAAATDAANRQARRTHWPDLAWTELDYNLAARTFERLWPMEAEYPWMTRKQADAARRQIGVTP